MSWSGEKAADANISTMCDDVKNAVLQVMKKSSFTEYNALKYIKTADSLSFVVKIRISELSSGCIHVQMHRATPDADPSYVNAVENKTADDQIQPLN